jgi:hypothetical protein
MRFRGRDHIVQIPYGGGGINVSLNSLACEINSFRRVFPVHYAPDTVVRIVVTFVEDDAVTEPYVDTSLANQLMMVASGLSEQTTRREYLPFFPAIRVPPGTIPIRDDDSLKSRLYLDAVSGHVPDEYKPLLAMIEPMLDLPAIIQAGSWFLTPRTQAAQPVETP